MEGSEAVRGDGPGGPCGLARERRGLGGGSVKAVREGKRGSSAGGARPAGGEPRVGLL